MVFIKNRAELLIEQCLLKPAVLLSAHHWFWQEIAVCQDVLIMTEVQAQSCLYYVSWCLLYKPGFPLSVPGCFSLLFCFTWLCFQSPTNLFTLFFFLLCFKDNRHLRKYTKIILILFYIILIILYLALTTGIIRLLKVDKTQIILDQVPKWAGPWKVQWLI